MNTPMEIKLIRRCITGAFTEGDLFVDGAFQCYTLEDAFRGDGEKIAGKTAIPAGRYKVIVNHSNRFNRLMPLLLDVPHFEGIRIHSGNTPEQTDGCILVGEDRTKPDDGIIGSSKKAYDKLFAKIVEAIEHGQPVFITVSGSPIAPKVHA